MYHYGIGMEPEVAVSKTAAAAENNFFERVTRESRSMKSYDIDIAMPETKRPKRI